MTYYITRHDSQDQATETYIPLRTGTDSSTPGDVQVPQGKRRISQIIGVISVDGAVTIDVGNLFHVKLSGKGLLEGDQELLVSGIASQETGTSVGAALFLMPAQIIPCNILVEPGQLITVSGAYSGTDIGTTFMSVTLGFD